MAAHMVASEQQLQEVTRVRTASWAVVMGEQQICAQQMQQSTSPSFHLPVGTWPEPSSRVLLVAVVPVRTGCAITGCTPGCTTTGAWPAA